MANETKPEKEHRAKSVEQSNRDVFEARKAAKERRTKEAAEARNKAVGQKQQRQAVTAAPGASGGTCSQGFSSNLRQQANKRRPLGFSAVRRLVKARTGSAKNMTPKREKRRSKAPNSNR